MIGMMVVVMVMMHRRSFSTCTICLVHRQHLLHQYIACLESGRLLGIAEHVAVLHKTTLADCSSHYWGLTWGMSTIISTSTLLLFSSFNLEHQTPPRGPHVSLNSHLLQSRSVDARRISTSP